MEKNKKVGLPISVSLQKIIMPKPLIDFQPVVSIKPLIGSKEILAMKSPLVEIGEMVLRLQSRVIENEAEIMSRFKSVMVATAKIGDGIRRMAEETSRTYPKLRDAVGPMGQRGWFLSGYCGISEFHGAALCAEAGSDVLDAFVKEMYVTSIDAHGEDLLKDYPHREFAIRPAIDAHNRKEYALSIPVFFAQAEGICFEKLKKYIFISKKPKKGAADENISSTARDMLEGFGKEDLDNLTKAFSLYPEVMWSHLQQKSQVAYSESERDSNHYDGLNRNTVMHGLDLKYATEENSLKAFSMLSYFGSFIKEATEEDEVKK